MDPERWSKIERIYHAALERDKAERVAFLVDSCEGDESLRREVESLLAHEEKAGSFLETPPFQVSGEMPTLDDSASSSSQGELGSQLFETRVSHYRILEKLGGGGMGVVYQAEDTNLGRKVALKFLPDEFSHDPQKLERFRREAWAASALNHPNICTIYEIGEHDHKPFIAMELVEGQTLAEKLKGGPLAIEAVMTISRQIAEALEEAHEHNIVHRDLKPANIMVTAKGRVKILDFGLAKLVLPVAPDAPTQENLARTRVGTVMGTVPYMAPEQLRGEPVDARADLYALGGVIYEMATGQRPFPETQTSRLIADILTRTPSSLHGLNPQVPAELETIVLKALAKDPENRYQSAQELLADLGPATSVSHPSLTAARKVPPLSAARRRPVMLVVAAGIAIGVLTVLLLFTVPSLRRRFITPPSSSQGLPRQKELAILPFSVIGGRPGDNAFSRGLAETLAAKLTQISSGGSLQVVPVGDLSARHVTTAREAKKAFGVNLVLSGSFERAGNQVRISFALIDPSTDRQISAQTLTLAASNPFGIEDQVVENTAGMLGLTVRSAERRVVESHGTQAAGAFQDYLKGLGYLQDYERIENIDKAIHSFQSALKADSTYTLAYAALGQAYWRKYAATEKSDWVDRAQESCGHAVTLNANLPATHLCLGIMESGTGQYAKALVEFQQVLQTQPTNTSALEGLASAQFRLGKINEAEATYHQAISVRPNYWAPYNWLGTLYFEIGKNEKAAEMFRKVTELAPQNHLGFSNLGGVDYSLGKWDEAEEMLKKSLTVHPSASAYSNLGTVTFYGGHFDQSAAYFEKAVRLKPDNPELWGNLADAYKWSSNQRAKAIPTYKKAVALARAALNINPSSSDLLGELALYEAQTSDMKQAMRHLQKAVSLAPRNNQIMYYAAVIYHLSGHRTEALSYLRKAVTFGYPVQALRSDPEWRGLKNDPAFQDLIATNKH